MDDQKTRWVEEVLESTKGIERAKPNSNLFAKIEAKISNKDAKIIPIYIKKYAGVAAAVLLLLNGYAIKNSLENNNQVAQTTESTEATESLISNFNIYQ
jgi:hypothetical protein